MSEEDRMKAAEPILKKLGELMSEVATLFATSRRLATGDIPTSTLGPLEDARQEVLRFVSAG